MQGHDRASLLSITQNKSSWRKTIALSELTQRHPVSPRNRYKGPWKGQPILNTPGSTGSSIKEPMWMVNAGLFLLPPVFPCVDFTRLSLSLSQIFLFSSQESRLSWSPVSSQFNKDNKPARSPAPGINCLSLLKNEALQTDISWLTTTYEGKARDSSVGWRQQTSQVCVELAGHEVDLKPHGKPRPDQLHGINMDNKVKSTCQSMLKAKQLEWHRSWYTDNKAWYVCNVFCTSMTGIKLYIGFGP